MAPVGNASGTRRMRGVSHPMRGVSIAGSRPVVGRAGMMNRGLRTLVGGRGLIRLRTRRNEAKNDGDHESYRGEELFHANLLHSKTTANDQHLPLLLQGMTKPECFPRGKPRATKKLHPWEERLQVTGYRLQSAADQGR